MCMPPPPPLSDEVASAMMEELQDQLLAQKEALAVQEEKVKIFEKVLVKVSVALEAERAKAEPTRKEYLGKMEAHSACTKPSLTLAKMLGRRSSSSTGGRGTFSCVRWHWWRRSPGASILGTTARS
jgi:hypothetical protein